MKEDLPKYPALSQKEFKEFQKVVPQAKVILVEEVRALVFGEKDAREEEGPHLLAVRGMIPSKAANPEARRSFDDALDGLVNLFLTFVEKRLKER